ncbi:MAG: alpha-hydroxy-acid oxidizing protein [Maritimibacter harenae]
MATAYSVHDYRRLAKRRLPKMVFDYLEGGAEDERGLARNEQAFDDWRFRPRRLVDVSERNLKTTLWARTHDLPVYVSPTGLNGLLRPDGDRILARAAAAANIPFALSTASNGSIEDVARACDGETWFQLYVMNRELADMLVKRALDADYDALILTVDVPVNGYRERDKRNGFQVPPRRDLRTLIDGALHPAWSLDFLRTGVPKLANFETMEVTSLEAQAALLSRKMDASFDWDALERLRDQWPRKLIVKGLSRVEDVRRCEALGVDAVILSNHGARQLDAIEAPIRGLEAAVADASIPVFVDSGVRRGADVIKGLCLGAQMVGLGRALLYPLAARGRPGVDDCLEILKAEMDGALALLGVPESGALGRDLLTD